MSDERITLNNLEGILRRVEMGPTTAMREGEDIALARSLFGALRAKILDGTWNHGDKLPGTRALARDAGMSRWTAVVAVDMLIAEGLVETRSRSGTYVSWIGNGAYLRRNQVQEGTQPQAPFAVGTPGLDLFPARLWQELQTKAWSSMPATALHTGHAAGWPDLQESIAAHVAATRAIRCSPDQVFVTTSAHAALTLACEVVARPGSVAWLEEPGYFRARAAVEASGVSPVGVCLDTEGVDIDDGLRLAPKAGLAVVTPSFQFPTGISMSVERRQRLLQWSADVGSFIIEDDYACEFHEAPPAPLMAMPGADRVLYMNSFSVTTFPSLRLCYLVVPRPLVERFSLALRNGDRYATVPNQIVLAEFLSHGHFQRHLELCGEQYRQRHDTLRRAMSAWPDVFASEPRSAGLHLCARFRNRFDDVAIAQAALDAGVVVEPLSRFFAGERKQSGLLLGFAGFPPAALTHAASVLGRILGAHA